MIKSRQYYNNIAQQPAPDESLDVPVENSKLLSRRNSFPMALSYESPSTDKEEGGLGSDEATKGGYGYGSVERADTTIRQMNMRDLSSRFPQKVLIIVTGLLSALILSSVVRSLVTSRPGNLDPRVVNGPLSMSFVHRDEKESYYEVLDDSYEVIDGKPIRRVLASGTYIRNAGNNGWNHLSVTAGKGYASSPSVRERSLITSNNYVRAMQAAGYLEGYATCTEISQYYNNFYFGLFDGGDPTKGTD